MPHPKLSVHSLEDPNQRRRQVESLNSILDHSADDSRRQTDAEKVNGITPVNAAYGPGSFTRTGATPSGDAADSTLNTDAINKALLPNSYAYEFIPGTYTVEDNLTAQDGQTIEMSMGVVLKATSWADTGIVDSGIIDIVDKADVHSSGGTIDGNKGDLSAGRIFGTRVQDSSDVTLSFQKIINCPGSDAAGTLGGDGWYVAGDSIRFGAVGMTCAGNVRNNAAIVQCDGAYILGGFYDGSTGTFPGAGIDLESDSALNPVYDTAVIGVGMRSNYRALQITLGTSGTEAIGNSLRGSAAGELVIANCDTVGFIGNHLVSAISVNGEDLCEIVNASYLRLIGNDFHGSGASEERSAIYIPDNVNTVIISGCIFRSTFSPAIRLGSSGMSADILHVVIVGNTFIDCCDPSQNAPIIHIIGDNINGFYPRRVTIRNNTFWDSRSGGDEATAAVQISTDIPDAVIADYEIGDNLIVGPASRYLNCPNEGSFTGTLTGVTGTPTASIGFSRDGDGTTTLDIPDLVGASTTTGAPTITGMPVYIRPASTQNVVMTSIDNSVGVLSRNTITSAGVININNGFSTTFTAANNKGAGASTVTYRRV